MRALIPECIPEDYLNAKVDSSSSDTSAPPDDALSACTSRNRHGRRSGSRGNGKPMRFENPAILRNRHGMRRSRGHRIRRNLIRRKRKRESKKAATGAQKRRHPCAPAGALRGSNRTEHRVVENKVE